MEGGDPVLSVLYHELSQMKCVQLGDMFQRQPLMVLSPRIAHLLHVVRYLLDLAIATCVILACQVFRVSPEWELLLFPFSRHIIPKWKSKF